MLMMWGAIGMQAQTTTEAKGMQMLEQVEEGWQQRTISDVKGGDILQLFEAFYRTWPTQSGRFIVDAAAQKAGTDLQREWLTVDHQNGYIEYAEDSPDSDFNEQTRACVWRRSNGHRLLAVTICRVTPQEKVILCFYDYNPQTATLTPEKPLANLFIPSFTGYRYRVELPRHGKNMEINEYYGWLTIHHAYSWDGMKPVAGTTTIEHFDYLTSQFRNDFFFDTDLPLAEYALVDIDGDGMPELWLQTEDEEYQALFSVWPTNTLLGGKDGRLNLSLYYGAVCSSGTCGALCMMSRYAILKDSSPKTWLIGVEEWNNDLDSYGPTAYTLQGEPIPRDKGERMVEALGEPGEFQPNWRKVSEK